MHFTRVTVMCLVGQTIVFCGLPMGGATPGKADDKKRSSAPQGAPQEIQVDATQPAPGSIWSPDSRLADAARDIRASQVDDLLTIVVAEQASAVTSGTTRTQRAASAKAAVTSLGGIRKPTGALANLAGISSDTQLDGQGTTSRSTSLLTTLTARVTRVLPGGALVVEASKDIQINSERQTITVRGVVRPADIDTANSVPSIRLGELDVRVNGKGVVGDAIRRPNFLYRLLLGLLPF